MTRPRPGRHIESISTEETHEETFKLDESGVGIEALGCEIHHRFMPWCRFLYLLIVCSSVNTYTNQQSRGKRKTYFEFIHTDKLLDSNLTYIQHPPIKSLRKRNPIRPHLRTLSNHEQTRVIAVIVEQYQCQMTSSCPGNESRRTFNPFCSRLLIYTIP